jgi:Ca2+:H+ antiporter
MGGFKYREQVFNVTAAQTSSSMLALTVMATMIPAAYSSVAWDDDEVNRDKVRQSVIHLSRATSVILLCMYCLCLYFQLKTHRYLLGETPSGNEFAAVSRNDAEEEEEESHMTMPAAIVSLLFVTVIIAVLAEFLVGSIEGFSEHLGLSETFIGIILVPIVGNAAEHVSAVSVAMKNKMDLALSVAIGSSTQIAMFVTPLMVVIGWMINQNMTLDFHTFESVVLFLTVFITNYLIQDGKSNWLEGAMLLAGYLIIALAFFYYP